MLLVELAAAVYLVSVLWPYAKRFPKPKISVPILTVLIGVWAVLWMAHIVLTALR